MLEGFTLTGGKGTKWRDIHIGGKYREGGGILIELSSPTIKYNLIVDNEAINKSGMDVTSAGGGAIRCGDGNPLILNNVIRGNQGLYGAGIVLNFSGGIIKNNIIYQNTGGGDYGGSGIWSYSNGSDPKIFENNTIVENSSIGSGSFGGKGGALVVWSTTVTACNNIIWGNTQSTGEPIAVISGTANVTFSDVEGGWSGEGNIDIYPTFADTNLYLLTTSPCVDSGNSDPVYDDPEDPGNQGFAQWPAQGGLRNDMGAYGGPLADLLPGTIITGIQLVNGIPSGFNLEQNYPNPFNPSTKIFYSIPKSTFVKLKIYDIFGREVKTLVNQFQTAGSYSADFNGSTLSGGIYFYILQTDNYTAARKMLLVE
ncbi:MAG: T9SS type A sorting domain-containing protein [Bacteroidales bacterium]|nr:T9SS type A sorting domain-containing protein [Bacteroidales bacterium]